MHLRIWVLIPALITALGCGDDADGEAVASKEETRTAALALTEAVDFENGISRTGAIPDSTKDSITLVPDTNSLQLIPGDSAEMTLSFENPDESKDPVDAVLLQFADSDDHIEVQRMAGDAGAGDAGAGAGDSEIKMPFSVDDKVCDKLCDKVFALSLTQAVKLRSGGVSKHKSRSFDLDCSKRGDHSMCAAAKATKPATDTKSGTGGSGGKSTGAGATLKTAFLSALVGFNGALCNCTVPPSASPQCERAALTSMQRECMGTFAEANAADVQKTLGCLNQELAKCNPSCDPIACNPSVLRNIPTACDKLPSALVADYQACLPKTDVAPPGAATDAGVPPSP